MKAIDRPFTKIINGTTQFVIPEPSDSPVPTADC